MSHAAVITENRASGARLALLRAAVPWVALLLITVCWDRAVYLHVRVADAARFAAMEKAGWYIALRSLGELYAWGALAVLLLLIDLGAPKSTERMRNPFRRAIFLILCPVFAGGVAEALKPIVGRFKPETTDGWFVFAGLRERLTAWSDLGMASSHAAVAFGAAFALSYIVPRGAPLFIAGAVGCAMTRLLAGAHFLSDVYVAILIAYAATRAIRAIDLRNNAGVPLAPGGGLIPRHG
jgi:membrane-associated phospholipid phosphatase